MKFVYERESWPNLERGLENCYLVTNGLGGYSSLTLTGANSRSDHTLFMACLKAPNVRVQMLANIRERLLIGNKWTDLSVQTYVTETKNRQGFRYLDQFAFEDYPIWYYRVQGVSLQKRLVMVHGENTLLVEWKAENRGKEKAVLELVPQLQCIPKGDHLSPHQTFVLSEDAIKGGKYTLYFRTNGQIMEEETTLERDIYYPRDGVDGRDAVGAVARNHRIEGEIFPGEKKTFYAIYSSSPLSGAPDCEAIFTAEENRRGALVSQAGITAPVGAMLVKSGDQFLVERASTGGKSIMAGYPFFTDWGRDTMIAMLGCTIAAGRAEETKSILRTFMRYAHNGLMPNVFPEGDTPPLYNTVDAALLFILAVREYYVRSKDLDFVREAWSVMEDILSWYRKGTDYHIRMEEDGLISAGGGLEQVTWMDVRFGEILPTPRHGKPVEINSYWYNALCIMNEFSGLLGKDPHDYALLAKKVKASFQKLFWNPDAGCLKDVISPGGGKADTQIRCNQIWAVSQPYSLLDPEQEKQVVDVVFSRLYTPLGLRSLDPADPDYHPTYGGAHFDRDMAYHQGTVWTFPLGAYYLAYLKVNGYSTEAVETVRAQLQALEGALREGCTGQLAEIYDGDCPGISQGCFAQAWSVGELIRVFLALDKTEE